MRSSKLTIEYMLCTLCILAFYSDAFSDQSCLDIKFCKFEGGDSNRFNIELIIANRCDTISYYIDQYRYSFLIKNDNEQYSMGGGAFGRESILLDSKEGSHRKNSTIWTIEPNVNTTILFDDVIINDSIQFSGKQAIVEISLSISGRVKRTADIKERFDYNIEDCLKCNIKKNAKQEIAK